MDRRLLFQLVLLFLKVLLVRPLVPQQPGPQAPRIHFRGLPKQLATATLMLLTSASPAFAGDIVQGQQLFNDNCASCHMGGANFAKPERTLKKDALEKYGIGVEQPSILSFVTNSQRHKNLVFFRAEGGKLNPQQWEDVTSYISDQAKNEKW